MILHQNNGTPSKEEILTQNVLQTSAKGSLLKYVPADKLAKPILSKERNE